MLSNVKHIAQHPTLRRLYAILWVAVVSVALLQSSMHPVIGPAQPPGPVSPERELFLTTAHLVAFSGMLVLIWWALHPAKHALLVALLFCWGYAIATELLQTLVPDRGASFYDLWMDFAAASIAALFISAHRKRQAAGKRF